MAAAASDASRQIGSDDDPRDAMAFLVATVEGFIHSV
jgi:hypothetical protein